MQTKYTGSQDKSFSIENLTINYYGVLQIIKESRLHMLVETLYIYIYIYTHIYKGIIL